MIVNTPSGLVVEVRNLKGQEANNLANKRLARKGDVFDTVLRSITTRIEDAGPYSFLESSSSVAWEKVLVCDRFYTLVASRIGTYGSEYIFPVQCVGGLGCDHRFEWELDIEHDIPVLDLPQESRDKIAAGDNVFEAHCDGRRVTFCLLTGKREKDIGNKIVDMKGELVTRSIASRILSVEGIPGKGQAFRDQVNAWLVNVDNGPLTELLADMEAVDGGFETDLEIQCPKCDRIFEVNIPFEGAPFWMPRSAKTKTTRKERRRGARTMASSAPVDPTPSVD